LFHEIVATFFRANPGRHPFRATFAHEVAPTCHRNYHSLISAGFCQTLSGILHGRSFSIYTSSDVIAWKSEGGKKRSGYCSWHADGMGFGANTRAALITRVLTKLSGWALNWGATGNLYGFGGLGDLILTCTDNQPETGASVWLWD